MNRIFILALILLLPLRGWSAESMNVQMARSMVSSTIAMMEADAAIMGMPTDCPMMRISTDVTSDEKSGVSVDHKKCKSCQLCMALVALGSEILVFTSHTPNATPIWSVSTFASAEVLRDSKPPIL